PGAAGLGLLGSRADGVVAELAGVAAAAFAEHEQVTGQVDIRIERYAQRRRLARPAARCPRGVPRDAVHDARAQLRLRRVGDRQRGTEEAAGLRAMEEVALAAWAVGVRRADVVM